MNNLKVVPLIWIIISLVGCKRHYSFREFPGEWEISKEISVEYQGGQINRCDTSTFCWLFYGRPFIKFFADSSYIVYDTISRDGKNFLEPYGIGRFSVKNDTLWLGGDGRQVIRLSEDSLVLKRVISYNNRINETKTLLVKKNKHQNFSSFDFPKNKIDTITKTSSLSIKGLDHSLVKYNRFERSYLYHKDTIFSVIRDFLPSSRLDLDSLIDDCDKQFRLYDMGDYGNQAGVCGHTHETIVNTYKDYITFYLEWHCYNQMYLGAFHGDWYHGYYTISKNGAELLLSDIIKPSAKTAVNFLIADAIIDYRIQSGWLNGYSDSDISGFRIRYANMNYENRAALGNDGLIISLDYGDDDAGICFAENYIHAVVPYNLIRPYLRDKFKNI